MKQRFATALITAIKQHSAQKLSLLCSNYQDQQKMGLEPDYSEEKLNEIVLKNCSTFLKNINFTINDYFLDSVTLKGAKDAIEMVNGHSVIFTDTVYLILKKENINSRLSIDVQMPIVIDNEIKINNPLLIECREYQQSEPLTYPDSITIIDSNKSPLKLFKCKTDIVRSTLKKHKTEAENYISDQPWYIYDGDMALDSMCLTTNTIINGNLLVHEPLAEIETNLIVLGKTICNAISLDETNDVFLLGGIDFNVAIMSMMPGPFRVLRNLNGPFVYTDSDSTVIDGVDNVTCFVDYVYGHSHGDLKSLIKTKYFEKIDDHIDIDAGLIAIDIKLGEDIFNNTDSKANFIDVLKPDTQDRDTVKALLKKDGFYIKTLSDEYRADKELIDIAINYNAATFSYIAEHLKNDDAYIYELIQKEGRVLEFVNERFKKDKNLVLLAIESRAHALDYAHSSLKADKEVVMAAINKNSKALEYADEHLQADEDIVLAVIDKNVDAFKYASLSVVDNRKIILALIRKAPDYLSVEALNLYANDKEFIMQALEENHSVFNHISENLQQDIDIRKLAGRV